MRQPKYVGPNKLELSPYRCKTPGAKHCFFESKMMGIFLVLFCFLFMNSGLTLTAYAKKSDSETGFSCPSRPEDLKKARELAAFWYNTGLESYRAEDFNKAVSAFECAQSILPVRLTRYWIARSKEDAGQKRGALKIYQELLVDAPPEVKKSELRQRINLLKEKVSRESSVPKDTDEKQKQPPSGKEADTGKKPRRALKRRNYTILGWASIGVGAALTILGTSFGIAYGIDKKKIEDAPAGTPWNPDLKKRYDRMDEFKTTTAVCLGLGLGTLAAGTLLLLLRPKEEHQEEKVSISITPSHRGVLAGFSTEF